MPYVTIFVMAGSGDDSGGRGDTKGVQCSRCNHFILLKKPLHDLVPCGRHQLPHGAGPLQDRCTERVVTYGRDGECDLFGHRPLRYRVPSELGHEFSMDRLVDRRNQVKGCEYIAALRFGLRGFLFVGLDDVDARWRYGDRCIDPFLLD